MSKQADTSALTDDEKGELLLTAVERFAERQAAFTGYRRGDLGIGLWTYVGPADEVPQMLREIADRLAETGQTMCGMWSTGFGYPEDAVLQVIVDPDRDGQRSQ